MTIVLFLAVCLTLLYQLNNVPRKIDADLKLSTDSSMPLSTDSSMSLPSLSTEPDPLSSLSIESDISSHENIWMMEARENDNCDLIFGNNFKPVDMTPQYACSKAGLKCWNNDQIKSTICTIDAKLVIDRNFIAVSAGGEPIETVLGRTDEEELPVFKAGALSVVTPDDSCISAKNLRSLHPTSFPHHLAPMLQSLNTRDRPLSSYCIAGTTFFVTRYEYANLYHTMTDWYNLYQASQYY